jgi:hypothetical protein
MVENEPPIWINRHGFYNVGFAAWASNSAHNP